MAVSVFFWARPREIGHQVPGDAVAGVGRDVNFGSLHFGLGSRRPLQRFPSTSGLF